MDGEEAQTNGWVEFVSKVKSKYDVEAFIKEHGGQVILSPDQSSLVLGGQKYEVQVKDRIEAIEFARRQPEPKAKNPTQKSLKYQRIAGSKGVLGWTSPFCSRYFRLSGSAFVAGVQSIPGSGKIG
jgi:hypothetical protein